MRKIGAALAVGVLLATAACGGSSRPSKDDLSQALRKGGENSILGASSGNVPKSAADCLAKVLVGSRISDRALQAIVDGNKNYKPTTRDATAAGAVRSEIVECLPSGLGN